MRSNQFYWETFRKEAKKFCNSNFLGLFCLLFITDLEDEFVQKDADEPSRCSRTKHHFLIFKTTQKNVLEIF
jgi:hypothetical protein